MLVLSRWLSGRDDGSEEGTHELGRGLDESAELAAKLSTRHLVDPLQPIHNPMGRRRLC